jgi:DNA oxidative demethylase
MNSDVVFKKSFLTLAEQKEVYERVLGIDPGFYVPVLRNGKKMKLLMNCLGHHWSAVTYKYSPIRDVDGRETAQIPDFLRELAQRAVEETRYWSGPGSVPNYDICIVNLYHEEEGKLGVHCDNSEGQESLNAGYPVVSLSIGATAVFTIGGLTRKDPQQRHLLESGDVVLFGRSMRLAYHGITRLVRGTTPAELGFRIPGRLNLTFRIL